MSQGSVDQGGVAACARGFDRATVSIVRHRRYSFPVCCEAETCQNVFSSQLWKVGQHLLFRHTGGQVGKDIMNCDSHAADTWLPTTFSRFNRNDVTIVHRGKLSLTQDAYRLRPLRLTPHTSVRFSER